MEGIPLASEAFSSPLMIHEEMSDNFCKGKPIKKTLPTVPIQKYKQSCHG